MEKMEKSESFLPMAEKSEKSPNYYILEEMRADAPFLTDEINLLVQKISEGKALDQKEDRLFQMARDSWWKEKYGFPYELKKSRNELIFKKYSPPESVSKSAELLKELFLTYGNNEPEKLEKIKKQYYEQYPNQLEGIEALFGLKNYFETQEKLKNRRSYGENIKNDFESLTEYQFLLTHFILQNQNNKEFLSIFWEALQRGTAKLKINMTEFKKLKAGILSQVAAFSILKKIGRSPKLSHPSEDAFNKIDMWMGSDVAFQIKAKGYKLGGKPEIYASETNSFPAVEVNKEAQTKIYFNTNFSKENSKFQIKIKEYGDLIGKNISGYMLVIPTLEFDNITGEPSDEIVEFFKEKLRF